MKKSVYLCDATNPAVGDIHTNLIAKYSVSSRVASVIRCGFVAELLKGVRSLFIHTFNANLLHKKMLQTNKRAYKVNYSNPDANTYYCRARWFGFYRTLTTFDYACDALDWHRKMTTGWRCFFCVAMAYYDFGGMRKMVNAFDYYALAVDRTRLSDNDIIELLIAGRY